MVHTIEVKKIALNRDDDKWIAKRDGISTLARGHNSLSWSPILGQVLGPHSVRYHLARTKNRQSVVDLKMPHGNLKRYSNHLNWD